MDYTLAAQCNNFSGLPGVDYGTADSHEVCVEELLWRAERAKRDGITYSVEPHFGSIMSTPEDALRMLEAVPGLKIVLDHSHYTHQGIGIERVAPMMHYASHIHARGAAKGEMQTSVARSETDFYTVCQHILEAGYNGRICMEYTYVDWENCNRTDNVSETILLRKKMAGYLGINAGL
jgi:sugar phosphate isomerase/epimerase